MIFSVTALPLRWFWLIKPFIHRSIKKKSFYFCWEVHFAVLTPRMNCNLYVWYYVRDIILRQRVILDSTTWQLLLLCRHSITVSGVFCQLVHLSQQGRSFSPCQRGRLTNDGSFFISDFQELVGSPCLYNCITPDHREK